MTQSRSGDRRGSRPGSVRPERSRHDSHRAARTVDPEWLDRLVVASCEMPSASGEAAVVEHVVLALRDIFPAYGVGVCFVAAPNSSADVDGAPREQRLFKRMPVGQEQRADGVDPSRLFPVTASSNPFPWSPGLRPCTLPLTMPTNSAVQTRPRCTCFAEPPSRCVMG